jgi:hypothetical protein
LWCVGVLGGEWSRGAVRRKSTRVSDSRPKNTTDDHGKPLTQPRHCTTTYKRGRG